MKKTLLASVAGALLCQQAIAAVGLPFYDPFAYPEGNLNAVGGPAWSAGNGSSTLEISVSSSAALLSPPGFPPAAGSGLRRAPSSTARRSVLQFTSLPAADGTSIFVAFLLEVQIAPDSSQLIGYLDNNSSSQGAPQAGIFLDSGPRVGIGKKSTSPGFLLSTNLGAGPHLIVAGYTFQADNDRVDLWVDPPADQFGAATAPPPLGGVTGASDPASLDYFQFVTSSGAGSVQMIDEFRLGLSWAEVTGSGTSAVLTPPVITQTVLAPAGLVLRGTNGVTNGTYLVVSSTDVTTHPSNWYSVGTNRFDGAGRFDSTNPHSSDDARRFYRLLVGGSASPPPRAPAITSQPQSRTVTNGLNATFTVAATGTAPLGHQWYFNSSTLLPGRTSATLTLAAVTTNDSGQYSVVISNVAGAVTSAVATLTVIVPPPSAPTIITQPQNQIATEGQNVLFTVAAIGTAPLYYQWHFNTDNPLAGRTNAALALNGVSTNDAGGYSVVVSNSLGAITSAVATLTVNPPSTNAVDFTHVGFGNNGLTVTGGAAGPTVSVGSQADLQAYADVNPPYTIYITNSFNLSGMSTHVRNNKTLIGLGHVVLSGGGLYLYRATNVIIRNLTITGSSEDNIGIHYSANLWIDHCTFADASDGSVDLTQQSDNITISWCRFYYTVNSGHNFVNLIASSDSDSGNYRITFHHNWWGTGCVERMPSVRFGRAHVFNNYYNAPGNNYCVRSRLYAECRIENNWFENVNDPWEIYVTSGELGKIHAAGNELRNTTGTPPPGLDAVFTPPYAYTLDPASQVPNLVTNHAGAGQGPFAP